MSVEAAPAFLSGVDQLEDDGERRRVRQAALRSDGAVTHGGEAEALDIPGSGSTVTHARLTHRDRPYPGHHLTFGQMAMAHDTLMPVPGLEGGLLAEEPAGDLGLYWRHHLGLGRGSSTTCLVGEVAA